MKKQFIIIFAALAAFILLIGGPAQSQDPPPATSVVTVVDEPPGVNCPDGGVKVTVTPVAPAPEQTPTETPTEEPTPDPTETAEPTPTVQAAQADQEPTVYYVCNGQQGNPGEAGLEGLPGMDGLDGQDGLGSDENQPLEAPTSVPCGSARISRLKLPRRFRGAHTVKLTVNAQRTTAKVRRHRFVRVDVRRLPCGYYPILLQRRGVRSALFLWHLTPVRISRQMIV